MSTEKDDPFAFPNAHYNDIYGMTLRDYFAAKAMQAAVSGQATSGETTLYAVVSGFAYDMADAMLEARK